MRLEPAFPASRLPAWLAFILLMTPLIGCAGTYRHSENRSFWATKLPRDQTYKGIVFVLHSPPRAEFAHLLAQTYPECFVVVLSRDDKWNFSEYMMETEKPARLAWRGNGLAHEVDAIIRWEGFFEPLRRISIEPRKLSPILVFHERKLTGCTEMPQPLSGSPILDLFWR